jgi:hypothetical protein
MFGAGDTLKGAKMCKDELFVASTIGLKGKVSLQIFLIIIIIIARLQGKSECPAPKLP